MCRTIDRAAPANFPSPQRARYAASSRRFVTRAITRGALRTPLVSGDSFYSSRGAPTPAATRGFDFVSPLVSGDSLLSQTPY